MTDTTTDTEVLRTGGPQRYLTTTPHPCTGCGAPLTDGIHAPFWAHILGEDPHYCDACWVRTAEYDGMVQTFTPVWQWEYSLTRTVANDGVPMWEEVDHDYREQLDHVTTCDHCKRPTTRLWILTTWEVCPECYSTLWLDMGAGDPLHHAPRSRQDG